MAIIRKTNFQDLLLDDGATILEALRKIDANKLGIIFIVNTDGTLCGSLTDGDVRRWLVANESPNLETPCHKVALTKCVTCLLTDSTEKIEASFREGMKVVPLLDPSGRVVAMALPRGRWLEIEKIRISPKQPTFVIAEIGINHNGDLDTAKHLVDAACHARADAIKFQLRHLDSSYRENSELTHGSEDLGAEYTKDLIRNSYLTGSQIVRLMDYVKSLGKIPLCTAWDFPSVEILTDYGVPAFKIASADLTNHPLLEKIIETGKPLILSSGMSTEAEILETIGILQRSLSQYAILHCNSAYPPSFKDINLNYLSRLAQISDSVVGYSGHERGFHIVIAAVALGARIVEKHITLDRTARGVDHVVSLEPSEFKKMVDQIRSLEESFGTIEPRELTQGEKLNRLALSKSLIASRHLDAGHTLTSNDVEVKSPGRGLQPNRLKDLLGITLRRRIDRGDFFYESDLEPMTETRRKFHFDRPWGIPVRFHDWSVLCAGSNLNFLEFHLSFRDLTIPITKVFPGKLNLDLVIHSPDLFEGDGILDLASLDDSVWLRSITDLQRVFDLTNQMAEYFATPRPKVIASLGGSTSDRPIRDEDRNFLYERVAEAVSKIRFGSAELLAQTLPPFPWYLGGQRFCNLFVDPEETADFSRRYSIAICLDTSHTKLACNHLGKSFSKAIEVIAPYTKHLHLVDAAGTNEEGLQINDGEIDWIHLLQQLSDLAPGVGFIPEIWQGHAGGGNGFWCALERLEAHSKKVTKILTS